MNYRKFGNTDMLVSEVGFGGWAIGGSIMVGDTPIGWGRTNDEESIAAINAAVDRGINFFDTADFYGLGHSESLLGKALRGNKQIILATKVGHRNINETIQIDYTKEYINTACEQSLRRLQREYIDYYQLHTARITHLEEGACIEAMEQLKRQGKIRYWGLSLNTYLPKPEADFLITNQLGDGFQLVFNIINQRAAGVIEEACQHHYGIIARMPLQFGLLTGKFGTDAEFTPDDHRSFRFNKYIIRESLSALEADVWPLCEKYNISKTSLALSYILSNKAISTVIPGIRTLQHVDQNTREIVSLDDADLDLIKKSYDKSLSQVVELMEQQG